MGNGGGNRVPDMGGLVMWFKRVHSIRSPATDMEVISKVIILPNITGNITHGNTITLGGLRVCLHAKPPQGNNITLGNINGNVG